MANFLDDLSIYNAKAAAAIIEAIAECKPEKANMMSSLKTTANDITLSEEVRLDALTALINLGKLLDIPLPPYFPSVTTYANTQTFVGIHNDLDGLQGGADGEYYHLTLAEKTALLNKPGLQDYTFANIQGVYSENNSLLLAFQGKQDSLPLGTGFLKNNGTSWVYDNSTYLTSISGPASGELSGNYPAPTLVNSAVTGKVLTGLSNTPGTVSATDSILSAIGKINANVLALSASSGTITSASLTLPTSVFNVTSGNVTSGAANLSASFQLQPQFTVLAGPVSGGTGVPTFRALQTGDLPDVPGLVVQQYGGSLLIPQFTIDAKGRITSISNVAAGTGGQVNTVSLTGPAIFNNFTSTGTTNVALSFGLTNQAINTVFAGPAAGSSGSPGFRALVANDIPSLPLTKITGLNDAISNKLDKTLNDGQVWIGNSTNVAQMRDITQDIEITNTGVATIQPNVVDFSKMQQITGSILSPATPGNLLGRHSAGTGNIEEIILSGDFQIDVTTGVLSLTAPQAPVLTTKGGLITYSQSVATQVQLSAVFDGNLLLTDQSLAVGLKWVTAKGDIEVDTTLLDGTFNITAGAVTLGKMANLDANRIIGNNTGNPNIPPIALTGTEVTAMLDLFSTTTTTKGLVQGGNNLGATYFLNAAGGWTQPSIVGTLQNLTFVSTTGDVPSTIYNGSVARSIGYGSVGAQQANVNLSSLASLSYGAQTAFVKMTAANTFALDINTYLTGTTTLNSVLIGNGAGSVSMVAAPAASDKLLVSNSGAAPSWSDATYPVSTSANTILYSSATNTVSQLIPSGTNTYLKWTGSGFTWDTPSGVGTVSSATAGQLAVYTGSGASTTVGGFTSSSSVIYSNSSGSAASLGFASGDAGKFLKVGPGGTSLTWDFAGGGSGTVGNGSQYQLAYYNGAGTTTSVIGLTSITASKALASDGSGLPVASTTTATQLGYLSGAAGTSGTGQIVFDTNPTLITPTLGVASATSINKVAITAPATSATLTIADGKTFTASNTLTLTGTDGSSVAFGAGGTVAYIGTSNSWTAGMKQTFAPSATTAGMNVGSFAGDPSAPANGDIVYNSTSNALRAYINGGWVSLGGGVTTPVSVANGGTGQSAALTQWGVIYASATTTMASSNAGTTGTVLIGTSSSAPSFSATPSATSMTLGVASSTPGSLVLRNASNANTQTITGTNYNAGASSIQYLWPSNVPTVNQALLASAPASGVITLSWGAPAASISIGSAITSATAGSVLFAGTSGVLAQNNTNFFWDNTNLRLSLGGSTSPTSTLQLAGATASVGHITFTPGTAALTGTTDGMLSYATVSNNSSLYLTKLYAASTTLVTKLITLDRNPDLAIGSANGVVISDASGSLSKSADLTALGILATTSTYATTATATNIFSTVSFTGTTNLPANFFGVGKTIVINLSGQYTSTAGSPTLVLTLAFGAYSQTFTINLHPTISSAAYWEAKMIITCSASGASGSLRTMANAVANDSGGAGTPKLTQLLLQTATSFNTTTSSTISLNASYTANTLTAPIDMCQIYYLN